MCIRDRGRIVLAACTTGLFVSGSTTCSDTRGILGTSVEGTGLRGSDAPNARVDAFVDGRMVVDSITGGAGRTSIELREELPDACLIDANEGLRPVSVVNRDDKRRPDTSSRDGICLDSATSRACSARALSRRICSALSCSAFVCSAFARWTLSCSVLACSIRTCSSVSYTHLTLPTKA